MPQLDKLSFISQYIWLTFFFFLFYYFILNFFVIMIFKNLKLRSLINELFFFRMFKVDFDKGIISHTNKVCHLYLSLVYANITRFFSTILKKRKAFGILNINYKIYFYFLNNIKKNTNTNLFKNINKINIDEI